jgi:hypothetical protein
MSSRTSLWRVGWLRLKASQPRNRSRLALDLLDALGAHFLSEKEVTSLAEFCAPSLDLLDGTSKMSSRTSLWRVGWLRLKASQPRNRSRVSKNYSDKTCS